MTEPRPNHPFPHGGPPWPTPGTGLALDPELLALPAPPRARRRLSLALLGAVMLAAASLLVHIQQDVSYALSAERVIDIGDATSAELAQLPVNRYVRVRGSVMVAHGARYQRLLSGDTYAVFPLAGQRQIFVHAELASLSDPARIASGDFTGRLVTFGQLRGRLGTVRAYLSQAGGLPVSDESFVVLAEEPPSGYRIALLGSAFCWAMLASCLVLLWRWFRPLA